MLLAEMTTLLLANTIKMLAKSFMFQVAGVTAPDNSDDLL